MREITHCLQNYTGIPFAFNLETNSPNYTIFTLTPWVTNMRYEFATCFGDLATKNTFELSDLQANDYFGGKDIKLEHTEIRRN